MVTYGNAKMDVEKIMPFEFEFLFLKIIAHQERAWLDLNLELSPPRKLKLRVKLTTNTKVNNTNSSIEEGGTVASIGCINWLHLSPQHKGI
jgi:hypothetical protein